MSAPVTDYYALLGLERAFDLDLKALEAAYFAAQRQYHPDRFIGKPQAERQKATQLSVDANNGYNILKNPHSRAIYLLKLENIHVADSKDAVKPSQELLMETMQWREDAQEATSPEQLLALKNTLEGLQSEAIGHISQAFKAKDFKTMAQHTMRLGYLIKTGEDIRQQLKRQTLAS